MYKSIDLEGKKLVGKGAHCEVYQVEDDRVLKLYFDHVPEADVLKEQQLAQLAIDKGLNTAGVYDIYEHDGRLGLMFEYIPSCTLTQYINKHPEDLEEMSLKFAKVAKQIHSIKVNQSLCGQYKGKLHARIDAVEKLYTSREIKKMHQFVDSIPESDTLLHTDFHPGNVMLKGKDLVLIDMADISQGHPLFDLASAYMGMVIIPENLRKVGRTQTDQLDVSAAGKMWDIFIREYLGTNNEEEIAICEKCCEAITSLRVAAANRIQHTGGETIGKRVVWLSRFKFFPKLGKYTKYMKKWSERR